MWMRPLLSTRDSQSLDKSSSTSQSWASAPIISNHIILLWVCRFQDLLSCWSKYISSCISNYIFLLICEGATIFVPWVSWCKRTVELNTKSLSVTVWEKVGIGHKPDSCRNVFQRDTNSSLTWMLWYVVHIFSLAAYNWTGTVCWKALSSSSITEVVKCSAQTPLSSVAIHTSRPSAALREAVASGDDVLGMLPSSASWRACCNSTMLDEPIPIQSKVTYAQRNTPS